jgi:hypothetical protein
MAPHAHHHHEADNQFLGKELKYFSQAGFDLDRIHIKVSSSTYSVTTTYTSTTTTDQPALLYCPFGNDFESWLSFGAASPVMVA